MKDLLKEASSGVLIACACVLVFVPAGATTQTRPLPSRAEVAQHVESLVRARLAQPDGPASISVAIVRRGEPLVEQAWGTAHVTARRPATPAMTYRIASINKQFTAALILKLVDRGKLSLRHTIADTLGPHFDNLRPEWRPITIAQLLNHTAGLPRDYRLAALLPTGLPSAESRVAWAARDSLVAPPGTRYLYSNTGYMLLSVIVEKLYGKRYDDAIRDEIAKPLGMTSFGACTAVDKRATETMGHARSPEGVLQPASELLTDLALGGGGLCSTAADLARWNIALHGGRVLSAASYAAMTTPRGPAASEDYGFGIRSVRMPSVGRVLTHDGATITFVSENSWIADAALSVTVFYNSAPEQGTRPLAAQLARIALGVAEPPPAAPGAGLEKFAGFYEGRPGRGFTVTVENRSLYVQPTGDPKQPLVLTSGTTYAAGGLTFTFTLAPDGRVTAVILRGTGREQTFPKVR